MKIVFRFLLLSILGLVTVAQADTKNMSAGTERLLANYSESWSTVDPAQRISILKAIWAEDGVHESPYGRSAGIAAINQEIEGFLKMFPGAGITFEDIRQTGSHIVCTFILKNPDGSAVMAGIDYFEINEDEKLTKVVGFVANQ